MHGDVYLLSVLFGTPYKPIFISGHNNGIPKNRPLTGRNLRKADGPFYPHFQKGGHEEWQNRPPDQLRADRERAGTLLAKEQHKLERLEKSIRMMIIIRIRNCFTDTARSGGLDFCN